VLGDVDQELVGVDVLRQREAGQKHVDEVLDLVKVEVPFEKF